MHDFHHEAAGGPHWAPDLFVGTRLARLHKGEQPQETTQDKRNKKLQEQLMKAQLKQIKEYKEPEIPEFPEVEPPSPLPGETPTDMAQAEQDARRQAARRKGLRRTIFGGAPEESGPAKKLGGQQTILG